MPKNPAFEFNYAVTRRPSASIVNGLRAEDIGEPDLAQMLRDHEQYVATLRETGADVLELDPLDDFPDSVFVEDDALCLPQGIVMMRPGAPSRLGEVSRMKPHLENLTTNLVEIKGPGFIEGGDILVTDREILVGTSERTDQQGISELAKLVEPWGHAVRKVKTPPGVLHFKTDCSLLSADTILATPRLSSSGCFEGYKLIHTGEGEEAAANAIRFNNFVLMAAGFPETKEKLLTAGFDVREINNSECAKLDGGMSCLSLRLNVN